jgi:coenzyme F420 hydrogenase subunit delta
MKQSFDCTPDYCTKPVLVLGCGNVLFGDDGFGPAVVEHLLKGKNVPANACFINAGSSAREILFNVALSEKRPQRVIVVDAMTCGLMPGAVVELELDEIPENKRDDFSMHQIPTSSLLRELRELCGIDVRLLVFEPPDIPPEVRPGLSEKAREGIRLAAETVIGMCSFKTKAEKEPARSE